MTKADLVEKVTGLGDLTRRDGEVIVETIFGFASGNEIPALDATPRPASAWKSPPSAFPTSSRPRSFATL